MADPHAPTPVRREDHGAVARLVLSSPQNYNALSREMIAALRDALDAIAADEAVRVVVIAAEGKAFSAGHDLRALQDGAKSRGANAVVDIVSYYKKNEFKSSTNYECYAGAILAGVALKGTYAKVK